MTMKGRIASQSWLRRPSVHCSRRKAPTSQARRVRRPPLFASARNSSGVAPRRELEFHRRERLAHDLLRRQALLAERIDVGLPPESVPRASARCPSRN